MDVQGDLPLFGTDYHSEALFHALLVNNDMPCGRWDIVRGRDETRIFIWFVMIGEGARP